MLIMSTNPQVRPHHIADVAIFVVVASDGMMTSDAGAIVRLATRNWLVARTVRRVGDQSLVPTWR